MNGQTNLSRIQVYMEPEQLQFLDYLSGRIKVTRSQIIRDLARPVTLVYEKVARFLAEKPKKSTRNPLLDLCGIEQSKTGHVAENIDEIYLHD